MSAFNNNKRAVESILVASGNVALVNSLTTGDPLPGGGTVPGAPFEIPLMNTTNPGQVNLASGQLGIFAANGAGVRGMNNALKVTDTYLHSPAIYIAQGTANAQSPTVGNYPLINNRPYESSKPIYGHNAMILTGKAAFYHTSSILSIGRPVATLGSINTSDLTEYAIGVAFRGYSQDVENSIHGYNSTTYRYTTPEYSALGLTDDLDHIVQNWVFEINRNSRAFRGYHSNWGGNDPLVSWAVGLIANGAQDITGAGFDNGGTVNVFIRNGVQVTYTLSAEQVASLRTALPATYGLLNVDLSTAGAAANAEWFIMMALDRDLAHDDRVPQVKIRLEAGLRDGFFETVHKTEETVASEGEGTPRTWQIFYENTHGQRKYYQFQRQHWPFIEIPSDIDTTTYYNVIILEHRKAQSIGVANISVSPKKTIILVPACDDTTMTSLLDYLNRWVQSCPSFYIYGDVTTAGNLQVTEPTFCP